MSIRRTDAVHRQWPLLLWVPVTTTLYGGRAETYQLLLGVQDDGPSRVGPAHILGTIEVGERSYQVYDAMVDDVLRSVIVRRIAPDLSVRSTELLTGNRTNQTLVIDGSALCTIFRRIESGPNPEVELTDALARRGFDRIAAPLAVWRRGRTDLAVVRSLVRRARPGHDLAAESLAELFERRVIPKATRSDFAREAERLGDTIARLHTALADAFGTEPASGRDLAQWLVAGLDRYGPDHPSRDAIIARFRRLDDADDLGLVTRIHGDLDLDSVLWTRRHWLVVGFEGDPARPVAERRELSSPMRDIAGLLRSFHYAAEIVAADQTDPDDPEIAVLAASWSERASEAFITGYTAFDPVHSLLPHHRASRDALLTVFEIEKALIEVADSTRSQSSSEIPERAVRRLVEERRRPRW